VAGISAAPLIAQRDVSGVQWISVAILLSPSPERRTLTDSFRLPRAELPSVVGAPAVAAGTHGHGDEDLIPVKEKPLPPPFLRHQANN
jgi:hypothetical protein